MKKEHRQKLLFFSYVTVCKHSLYFNTALPTSKQVRLLPLPLYIQHDKIFLFCNFSMPVLRTAPVMAQQSLLKSRDQCKCVSREGGYLMVTLVIVKLSLAATWCIQNFD